MRLRSERAARVLLYVALALASRLEAQVSGVTTINSFGGSLGCSAFSSCLFVFPRGGTVHYDCTYQDPLPAGAVIDEFNVLASVAKGDPNPVSTTFPAASVAFSTNTGLLGAASYSSGTGSCPTSSTGTSVG